MMIENYFLVPGDELLIKTDRPTCIKVDAERSFKKTKTHRTHAELHQRVLDLEAQVKYLNWELEHRPYLLDPI